MEQGDILHAADRRNHPHPIIYIKKKDSEHFYACIISHDAQNNDIRMKPEHFHVKNKDGKDYTVQYNIKKPSYLVFKKLIKENLWIEDEAVKGKLTDEGIAFVIANTPSKEMAVVHKGPIWEKQPYEIAGNTEHDLQNTRCPGDA
ncbi:MAG: hypothetical protein LBM20_09015 [Rikenellaceae bacterium]|jgi:hypothetical protein|nr:hypothetical protein [Rikenellaceae bacterium]